MIYKHALHLLIALTKKIKKLKSFLHSPKMIPWENWDILTITMSAIRTTKTEREQWKQNLFVQSWSSDIPFSPTVRNSHNRATRTRMNNHGWWGTKYFWIVSASKLITAPISPTTEANHAHGWASGTFNIFTFFTQLSSLPLSEWMVKILSSSFTIFLTNLASDLLN